MHMQRKSIRITTDFFLEIMQAIGKWNDILKC